jgi:hypothetical protein
VKKKAVEKNKMASMFETNENGTIVGVRSLYNTSNIIRGLVDKHLRKRRNENIEWENMLAENELLSQDMIEHKSNAHNKSIDEINIPSKAKK